MSKNAKRKGARKGAAETEAQHQQTMLTLTEFVRRNLLTFVIAHGMMALDAILEEERTELCGPAHARTQPGQAQRWGFTEGTLVMGGQKVTVRRPRARRDDEEVVLPTWLEFADTDPLDARTVEQMAIGVSTRNYSRSVEPVPDSLSPSAKSKSAVSRRFVSKTREQLDAWLRRDLSAERISAIMIDGIEVDEYTVVIALGITESGEKQPLGLYEGATENAVVCQGLLDNLIERGLDERGPYLFVIDGSKALHKAIRKTFGRRSLIQRCQEHKRRNVLSHLPKKLHTNVNKAMKDAYRSRDAKLARRRLGQLAARLEQDYPSAAASVREGMDETLTVKAMGLPEALERTLSTTNPIENLNGTVRRVGRRVKRWKGPDMVRRWVALGVLEAQRGFRRLRGYLGMPILVAALQQGDTNEGVDAKETAA